MIGKARAQVALTRQGQGDASGARALLDSVLQSPDQDLTPELRAPALAARAEARPPSWIPPPPWCAAARVQSWRVRPGVGGTPLPQKKK
ncbi:MAG TPA: hypothetical protein VKB92_03540 [Myxococcales bacterium]|nr:hypothetical protein [Myxococcales bacterium]